jgi:hypothetical protein
VSIIIDTHNHIGGKSQSYIPDANLHAVHDTSIHEWECIKVAEATHSESTKQVQP